MFNKLKGLESMSYYKSISLLKSFIILITALLLTACIKHSASQLSKGSIPATACAGNAYLQKYACSVQRISQEAQSSDPDAQYALGYLYYYGIGTIRDKETALLWINRAAQQGQPLAKKANQLIANAGHFSHLHHYASHSADRNQVAVAQPLEKKQKILSHAGNKVSIGSYDPRLKSNAPPMAALTSKKYVMTPVEEQIMKVSKEHYTLQLMAGLHLAAIKHFIQQHDLEGKAHYYSTRLNHEKWYMLVYGNYPTAMSAKAATHRLSLSLRKLHPWVKSYRIVQSQIHLNRIVS